MQSSCGVEGPLREQVKLDVYITMRSLAGASYLGIALSTGLSIVTRYARIDTMISVYDQSFPLRFPHDEEEGFRENSAGFARGRSPLTRYIGVLDGLAVKIH